MYTEINAWLKNCESEKTGDSLKYYFNKCKRMTDGQLIASADLN